MTRPKRIAGMVAHRSAILLYILFALFPLYWLLKVSVTPNDLLYSEGVRMWPSRASIASRRSRKPCRCSTSEAA